MDVANYIVGRAVDQIIDVKPKPVDTVAIADAVSHILKAEEPKDSRLVWCGRTVSRTFPEFLSSWTLPVLKYFDKEVKSEAEYQQERQNFLKQKLKEVVQKEVTATTDALNEHLIPDLTQIVSEYLPMKQSPTLEALIRHIGEKFRSGYKFQQDCYWKHLESFFNDYVADFRETLDGLTLDGVLYRGVFEKTFSHFTNLKELSINEYYLSDLSTFIFFNTTEETKDNALFSKTRKNLSSLRQITIDFTDSVRVFPNWSTKEAVKMQLEHVTKLKTLSVLRLIHPEGTLNLNDERLVPEATITELRQNNPHLAILTD